jgi:hypothetical protein
MKNWTRRAGPSELAAVVLLAASLALGLGSCSRDYRHVTITPSASSQAEWPEAIAPVAKLDPILRYGGYVLTSKTMPHSETSAYLWAKNMGTLVAYETYLRRYPDGPQAPYFRDLVRQRFVPADKAWQEAWQLYSRMEIIDGAVCDTREGFILIGRPGTGRLSPFHYEDLITAIRCSLADEKVGVTMNRIFPSRETPPPQKLPYESFEISVDFYSRKLWNTHLAYVLFEADRALKSLSHGYDIFLREPVRSKVAGFATIVEMASALPPDAESGKYGRIWIELTSVRISTTEARNVAMFSDVQLAVRAESRHEPPMRFAEHLRENYAQYAAEFPIFAEVERSARVVAIARWLVKTYPDVAQKLIDESYEQVKVYVPQVIPARVDVTHEGGGGVAWLIGGVVFPKINRYENAPDAKVADTALAKIPTVVLESRPQQALAWNASLGKADGQRYIAWHVAPPKSAARRADSPPIAISRKD